MGSCYGSSDHSSVDGYVWCIHANSTYSMMQVRLTLDNSKKAKVHAAALEKTVPEFVNELVEKAKLPKKSDRDAVTRYAQGEEQWHG